MRTLLVISATFLAFWTTKLYAQNAHQPYASHWFPKDLMNWSPKSDNNAKFNRSVMPLKKRFVDQATQMNINLSTDPKIMSLVAAHPTSKHPSQGFQDMEHYAFPFWQYLDYFVQWGGSADEGLIVAPAFTWINAAHKNGVAAFGTVYFPPEEFGGVKEWLDDFLLQKSDGSFPIADKLIEVADHYGFDGWFINQETNLLEKFEAENIVKFLKYFQKKSNGRFKLVWYDSMIEDGRIIWQEELNKHNVRFFQDKKEKVSDFVFLDFGWSEVNLEDSKDMAKEVGRSPYELFAGIDLQSTGYESFANWRAIYPKDKPGNTSLGMYWPNSTFDLSEDKSPDVVYERELKLWNGGLKLKVSDHEYEWKGISNYFPARSVITEAPFITRFNYGVGKAYYDNGTKVSNNEWHNLSSQDILPTWQWKVDTNMVKANFSFDDAFIGGSSLKLQIKKLGLGQKIEIPLYKMNLSITSGLVAFASVKNNADVTVKIEINTKKGQKGYITFDKSLAWNTRALRLDNINGEMITKVNLIIEANKNIKFQNILIGEFGIKHESSAPINAPEASLETFLSGASAEAYLNINWSDNVWYYNVYKMTESGSREWLGQAWSEHYYIPEIKRGNDKKSSVILVQAVNKDGVSGEPTSIKMTWK